MKPPRTILTGSTHAAEQRTVGISNLLLPSGVGLPIRWKGPCSDRNLPSFPASVLLCRGGLDWLSGGAAHHCTFCCALLSSPVPASRSLRCFSGRDLCQMIEHGPDKLGR